MDFEGSINSLVADNDYVDDDSDDTHERKKMKKRSGTGTELSLQLIDGCWSDMAIEIFSKIPIKYLFQCMCVSKNWYSFIHNPSFALSYRTRNPNYILVSYTGEPYQSRNPNYLPVTRNQRNFVERPSFYYCPLLREQKQPPEQFGKLFNFSPFDPRGDSMFDFLAITQVVNGFFCYYSHICVFIANVFTREIKRLPPPSSFSTTRAANGGSSPNVGKFYFGFDPVNGVYKLLFMSRSRSEPRFEILTLGNTESPPSWRELPPQDCGRINLFFRTCSFLVNGVLYWVPTVCINEYGLRHDFREYNMLSFNLNEEKFRYILPPKCEPKLFTRGSLVQFRGRLSFLFHDHGKIIIIYTLEDTYDWSRHEATLPAELSPSNSKNSAFPVGNFLTGEILLANFETGSDSVTPVYSYDYHNNNFERFVVGKFPGSLHSLKDGIQGRTCVPYGCEENTAVVSRMELNMARLDSLLHGCAGGIN